MPRPSQRIDLALLQSGRELFPTLGCAGLSVRALAEHAGTRAGMFHYHFKTKDDFLRTLLQQEYDAMFATLGAVAEERSDALDRLRGTLNQFARFARDHRSVFARVLVDALGGQPVAADFMRRNAPRHLGLLMGLLDQAERAGALRPLPPIQRFVMLMGAVAVPVVLLPGIIELAVAEPAFGRRFEYEVLSDAGIAERIELLIAALAAPKAARQRGRKTP